MRRFTFRLQRVLDMKGQLVQEARRALGQALAAELRAHERLQAAQTQRQRHLELLAQQEVVGLSAQALANHRRYQDALLREETACLEALQAARARVQAAREGVVSRRQEERSLETLREHRWEEYQQEAQRLEQADMDERASRRTAAFAGEVAR